MGSVLQAAFGFVPRWLAPLLFVPALILGREEAATVAHSARWPHWVAIGLALAVYSVYVPVLVRATNRRPRLRRTVDRFSSSRLVAWLLRHMSAGPLWWQCAKAAVLGFVPTIGFGAGILWARCGPQRYRPVRMAAVVAGASASYLGYHDAIGWILALPLVLGAAVIASAITLAIGWHHRQRLRPLASTATYYYRATLARVA